MKENKYGVYIGKTLSEMLNEFEEETLIYLGSQTSFFDITPSTELKRDEYLKELNDALQKNAVHKFSVTYTRLMRMLEKVPLNTVKHLRTYAVHIKPLKERVIQKMYPRIDETGVCVIIEGNETGGYWFLSEKQAGKRQFGM